MLGGVGGVQLFRGWVITMLVMAVCFVLVFCLDGGWWMYCTALYTLQFCARYRAAQYELYELRLWGKVWYV